MTYVSDASSQLCTVPLPSMRVATTFLFSLFINFLRYSFHSFHLPVTALFTCNIFEFSFATSSAISTYSSYFLDFLFTVFYILPIFLPSSIFLLPFVITCLFYSIYVLFSVFCPVLVQFRNIPLSGPHKYFLCLTWLFNSPIYHAVFIFLSSFVNFSPLSYQLLFPKLLPFFL